MPEQMRAFASIDCLNLWESGVDLHPLDQALLILRAALPPDTPQESLADWPLGRRNRALFELHRYCFGSRLPAWAACARCQEKMEFAVDSRELMAQAGDPEQPATVVFRGESYRLPTTRNLAFALAGAVDPETAAVRLLESCQLTPRAAGALSVQDIDEIGEFMAAADPAGETRIALRCPACGHEQDEVLDIATFLWAEIAALAKRLLREVHALASAYGWTEAQVLSLSAARRTLYMEMLQA
jgi:hypothetical protein